MCRAYCNLENKLETKWRSSLGGNIDRCTEVEEGAVCRNPWLGIAATRGAFVFLDDREVSNDALLDYFGGQSSRPICDQSHRDCLQEYSSRLAVPA